MGRGRKKTAGRQTRGLNQWRFTPLRGVSKHALHLCAVHTGVLEHTLYLITVYRDPGKEAGKRTAEKDNWRGPFSIRIDPALSGQSEDTLVVYAAARSGYGALYGPVWLAAQPKRK